MFLLLYCAYLVSLFTFSFSIIFFELNISFEHLDCFGLKSPPSQLVNSYSGLWDPLANTSLITILVSIFGHDLTKLIVDLKLKTKNRYRVGTFVTNTEGSRQLILFCSYKCKNIYKCYKQLQVPKLQVNKSYKYLQALHSIKTIEQKALHRTKSISNG